jgi:outer membrane lipoprotein-sorting protein
MFKPVKFHSFAAIPVLLFGFSGVLGTPPTLTASEILERAATAYSTCSSFHDVGTVTKRFITRERVWSTQSPFELAYARPDSFKFESTMQDYPLLLPAQQYGLLSNGDTVIEYNSTDGLSEGTDLSLAIARVSGVSGGSAHTLARLLMPASGGFSLTELQTLSLVRTEDFGGHSCFVLEGKYPAELVGCRRGPEVGLEDVVDGRWTLWIDTQDFLLRKLRTENTYPEAFAMHEFSTITEEIHRNVTLNGDIPAETFVSFRSERVSEPQAVDPTGT